MRVPRIDNQPQSAPLADVMKAIASQLIVWHHLAFYGPMSDRVAHHASTLFAWLRDDARLAVQVFIVIGGFLGARTLHERWSSGAGFGARAAATLIGRRYLRLAKPYGVALGWRWQASGWRTRCCPMPTQPCRRCPRRPTWPPTC